MKKFLSLILFTCMMAGIMWTPAKAASKKMTTVRINGVLAPVERDWIRENRSNGIDFFYEDESSSDELLYVIISESAVSVPEAKKLAGLLSKKSSKSKICNAINKLDCLYGAEFTKKDLTLKQDPNGKYMAILNVNMDTETDYMVIRNIDDRFIVIYGVAYAGQVEISSEQKKKVLKYAKQVVADEIGMSVKIFDDIVLPYDDNWVLEERYSLSESDTADFLVGSNIEVGVLVDHVDADEDTVKVASLLSDKKNFEELKELMIELLDIPSDQTEYYPFEISFSMKSDGHGSNYFAIDAGAGIAVFRVIDGKYIIVCEALNVSYESISKKTKKSVIKFLNGVFVED